MTLIRPVNLTLLTDSSLLIENTEMSAFDEEEEWEKAELRIASLSLVRIASALMICTQCIRL
jgi:hypothetical protein